jgi:hypothetical protein
MVFQTQTSATDQELIDSQRNFKLCTELAESTAKEKMSPKREKTASDRAMQVNSSGRKSPLFQGTLAERPRPERQLQPLIVGGGSGIRTHGTLARTTVFETAPFDRSGIPPRGVSMTYVAG